MATWNGSCQGSEDSNYLLYSDQNSGGYNVDSWTFYSRNDAYFPNASVPYSQNKSAMFEQREPTAFCQISSNVSSNPSTSMPLPDTQHQGYSQLNVPHNRLPNKVQCYQKDNSHLQNISTYSYQNNNHGKRSKSHKNNSKYTLPQENNDNTCNIVERSNLRATAKEFIPHWIKLNRRENRSKDENTLVNDNASKFYLVDCVPQTVKNTFTSDDMDKQERRHDFKRDTAYKQRDIENNQYYKKGAYKNSYRMHNNKNYGKFQNDRYYNSRQYTENPRKKIQGEDKRNLNVSPNVSIDCSSGHKSSTSIECEQGDEFTNSQVAQSKNRMLMFKGRHNMDDQRRMCEKSIDKNNSLKAVSDKSSENDYYKHNFNSGLSRTSGKTLRKSSNDHRIDRFENNYRERRNVYQDYNDHKTVHSEGNKIDKSKDKDRSKDSSVENKEREVVNWRYKGESSTKNNVQKRGQNKKYEDDDASQRERLTEQLNKGQLECLVCCEYIKQNDYIWSCTNCYHVLHLKCIKKWAKSSHSDNGWRCPACQNVNCAMPKDYFCFCGKTKMPEWNRRDIAHSCGEICGRSRSKNNCAHKCTLLCHPGSCPLCIAMVTKYCGCGKTSQTLKCSTATLLLCDSVCGKILDCEKHMCEKKCHHGECGPCEKSILQECFCGKSKREITCKPDLSFAYSCENVCEKLLDCKNHKCQKICHSSECESCSLTPDKVTTCYCAQTLLTEERKCCLDPIPTCDKICSKQLKCGQPSNPHTCKVNCHEGECPDCELTTDVRCRCGNMDREIACKDLTFKADDAQCEKKCIKKRSCGKHKCNQLCCIDIEHVCPLICFKTLSCGRHKCEQTCHKGRCQPCWRSSFDELYCECGTAVIYPPVPCGTRRPICDKPCLRSHPCGHEVLHNCHSEPTCPPCTVLTQKWCYGKHELRKAVPCYVNEVSCGLPCNKPLSCGRHKCITICHPGSCEKPGQNCIQPCTTLRELCGHICAAPCHDGKCPDTPCKEMVKVTCQCGHRSTTRVCAENAREYQRIASNILASKMADMQLGHSIDLEEVFGQGAKKQNQLKSLECNDECKLIERNRRLALGLQIVNPDLSGKLMPRYSEYMKQWAKKDSHFCQMVHDKLTELVQLAKTSKQKSRSYSFDSMNKDKRHFVHESCEHFGCESQAYDQEPKRNVVATAIKHKCWLPSYSLLEMMQRENGQRKVPGPMLNTSKGNNSTKTILALPAKRNSKPLPTPSTSRSPEPEIDYFDYKG